MSVQYGALFKGVRSSKSSDLRNIGRPQTGPHWNIAALITSPREWCISCLPHTLLTIMQQISTSCPRTPGTAGPRLFANGHKSVCHQGDCAHPSKAPRTSQGRHAFDFSTLSMLGDKPSTHPSSAAPCISSEPAGFVRSTSIIAELFRQRHRRVTPSIPPNAVARRAQDAIPRDIRVDKSSHKGAGGRAPSQRLTAVVLLDPRPRADLCDIEAESATISMATVNVANRGCGRYHFETLRRAQTYSMMYQYCNHRQRSDLQCLASCVPAQHVDSRPG
jgi:hypothetical protein